MKNITKLAYRHDRVRATTIVLRSIAASSSWRSPVIVVKPASEITSAVLRVNSKELALISFPMRWVEGLISRSSRVFTALLSRTIFIFPWIQLSFIHKTHALSNLFSNCHVKKNCIFFWATIRPDFSEHSTFRLYWKSEKLQAKVLNSTRRTISLWSFGIFDSFSLVQPIGL